MENLVTGFKNVVNDNFVEGFKSAIDPNIIQSLGLDIGSRIKEAVDSVLHGVMGPSGPHFLSGVLAESNMSFVIPSVIIAGGLITILIAVKVSDKAHNFFDKYSFPLAIGTVVAIVKFIIIG